ncbi:MAG: D-2-hydroxyacid dehydrogenase [Caldilineaceae bacterium]|nr:D-2-hydroxyacid dehydrogenase [Caldilineaceae bacterium]
MHILIHYPFTADEVEEFRQIAPGHKVSHAETQEEAIVLAADAEVIMGYFMPPVCAAAPNLRWVQSFSAGMDNFLFPEIVERDVTITGMAAQYAPQGAEHAWALLLALARGIPLAVRQQDQRQWKGGSVLALTGATLGIIGMGGFGLEMVKRAAGYDMQILALDPIRTEAPAGVAEIRSPTRENIHDLLRRSDAVMIACPRTPETYHLMSRAEFAAMKPTAFLINVTRGGIVDEEALAEALKSGEIAGAALDVVETEPLHEDSPLWNVPNLLLTPHRAGASQHRHRQIIDFFKQNLAHYLAGEPLRNVVDKRRGF